MTKLSRTLLVLFAAAAGVASHTPACAQIVPESSGMLQHTGESAPGAPNAAFVSDPATMDGCEVIARIDGQVVLACEVLWQVNRMLEQNRERIPPEQYEMVREQLIKRYIAQMIDNKLVYREFVRAIPPENLPRIEENLLKPFEELEEPKLMKQLGVNSRLELERELSRLGSSINDARRAFNERAVAQEWVRSKVKINEEIRPDEMLDFYRRHAADYDYPAQVRWEELMIRKGRFASAAEAYAATAMVGNEAWQAVSANPTPGTPAFTELAKAKSDALNAKQDGGQHDWTTRGALKAVNIDEALFTLPVGALSPILESETAFHIVRVLERKDAGRTPFTDVQAQIREDLKAERFRDAVDKYLVELRRNASIWTVYTGPTTAEALLGGPPNGPQRR